MGQVFALAKTYIDLPPSEIEKLLESPIHEVRVCGPSIMDKQARCGARRNCTWASEAQSALSHPHRADEVSTEKPQAASAPA